MNNELTSSDKNTIHRLASEIYAKMVTQLNVRTRFEDPVAEDQFEDAAGKYLIEALHQLNDPWKE